VSPAATADALRTALLLCDAELAEGAVAREQIAARAGALAVLRARPVPPVPVRFAQDVARKLGRLDHERAVAAPLAIARRALLEAAARPVPPRFLVRVDEFPHYQAWDDPARFGTPRFERFHEILTAAGVPYLVAVLPRVSRAPLDPTRDESRTLDDGELAVLARLAADGVALALHGRDHRTRFASPRRHSELCGLDPQATAALLEAALAELASHGVRPDVFVAPYNRFDAAQWPLLAERFAVVCGGPESIRRIGFQRAPTWRGDAVYLPSYAPFYGPAREVLPAAERAIEQADGLWTPIVLHWGWEADAGWEALERLLARIAPHAARWEDFHAAVERSRGGVG
jgi:peptidoglycan/xylan/chitin deacetylase (PgdA/CDA1 family)